MRNLSLLVLLSLTLSPVAEAARFGGMCSSQGTWLKDALNQSKAIIDALETLRNDPNCQVLTQALERAPKIDPATQQVEGDSDASFANMFREFSAIKEYVRPSNLQKDESAAKIQDAVFNVVFNKSYESLKDLNNSADMAKFSESRRESIKNVSVRLKNFVDHAEKIANITMETSRGILAAMPQSQKCMHNQPSAAATIFGAVAHASASLVSGGKVNGVGEFTAALLNFSRDMSYMKSLKPLEHEEFKNSVSCLVESTSEAYCSVQDAEDTLNTLRKAGGTSRAQSLNDLLANSDKDPIASSLGGLVIYMRDIPVVQNWLQKVLFGVSPRTSDQGEAKNKNWSSYLGFIRSVNSLQGNFTDKEQLYYTNTQGKDRLTKVGQIREIFDNTLGTLLNSQQGASVNFYTRTMQEEQLPFFLLGTSIPADFNSQTRNLNTIWLKWSQEGTNGFDNPDRLLQTIKENLWKLTERAQREANALFAQRMIVDPQNLVTEAMRGPGVSPYQAFVDQRLYYLHLIAKFEKSIEAMGDDLSPTVVMRRDALRAHIPLLKDSVTRLENVIRALRSVGDISQTDNISSAAQSEKVMDVVYSAANMIVSWDSFFGTRMQTALQADLSDTLWRKSSINPQQKEYLMSVGPEIVGKLAGIFSSDPVSERTDLNAAKVTHIANLKAVEEQFSSVLFNEILDIDCKLEGGYACDARTAISPDFDPAGNMLLRNNIKNLNYGLRNFREGKNLLDGFYKWLYPASEDSRALVQVRAKYCVQALAFESRELFSEICKGAVLESEFSGSDDSLGLNTAFETQLEKIKKISTDGAAEKIDRARNLGVCSLRSYLRKNHVYFMYRDYNSSEHKN